VPDALQTGLVFWQNSVSLHQAGLMRALADLSPGPVTVVAESGISPERRAMGWSEPDYGAARLVVTSTPVERQELEHSLSGGSVHVFSGITATPGTSASLRSLLGRQTETVGLFMEPWDPGGWRGLARALRYRRSAKAVRDRVSFLLTTGPMGRRQYQRAGFAEDVVVDFGYFVPHADASSPVSRDDSAETVRLAFVGSLTKLKRVNLLLRALAGMTEANWQLDVVGDGPERPLLTRAATALGLTDRVTWHGVQPNDRARTIAGDADVLVLPSRYDGWGVVVNEALLFGSRVVVSDGCGSQAVAEVSGGAVFPSGDEAGLRRALERMVARSGVDARERAARRAWATAVLSPDAAAEYLLDSLSRRALGLPASPPPWSAALDDEFS
jgi:glycosyltransferase involved in cell wall biosynthesis